MRLSFNTLDVFTQHRLAGNPLAVVHDADELSSDQMQAIAREFALSETVFMLKPLNPMHSARVRIFTPKSEIPFAGHPTVGTAVLLSERRGGGNGGQSGNALVVLEQEIGLVRVGVRLTEGRPSFAEFDVPRRPELLNNVPETDRIASAVGLMPSEVGFANHRPALANAGNTFLFVPVASMDAIAQAHIAAPAWQQAFAGISAIGACVYTAETVHTTSHYHARVFAPGFGVPEDPATGSAAAAFAGVVHRCDDLPDGMHRRTLEQGYEMGRPSEIEIEISVSGRQVSNVRIGGYAVNVCEGTLEI
jgi:trans-2,3-dihydro-3-hydroxyanthranilate isomerase